MNVGIVSTWFERGAAYVSRQILLALEPVHRVFVYARGGEQFAKGDPIWDSDRVWWGRQGVAPVLTSFDLDDFRRWITTRRLDLVWFNEQYWWVPVLTCHELGVTTGGYMVTFTEDEIPLFGAYDFLTTPTRQYHEQFCWHSQCLYLPWGTDLEVFAPARFDPVEPGMVTFFHSAGVNPHRKGTDQLLRAFARVDGPARLIIHSQVSLREALPDAGRPIDDLTARGTLTVHERTVPAPGLFRLGDVYVYPSRIDSLGLTVAEALACGLPVIAPDNAPMNEFVDESSGRLVRIARHYARADGHYWPQVLVDESDLARQMQHYVDDRTRLGQYRRAARAYAERHLDWKRNAAGAAEYFATVRRIPGAEKAAALARVRTFEEERARRSPQAWMSHHYPRATRLTRALYRAIFR